MWNLFIRLGMVMSTVLLGKQVIDHFWPAEIHPNRLYNAAQAARYLGCVAKLELPRHRCVGRKRWIIDPLRLMVFCRTPSGKSILNVSLWRT